MDHDLKIIIYCCLVIALPIALLGGLIYSSDATYQSCLTQSGETEVSNTTIVSLADNSGVAGTFILGSGSVHSVSYFAGYTQNADDGSYSIVTFKASGSKIYQDLPVNSTEGYVIEYSQPRCFHSLFVSTSAGQASYSYYKIHIPEGSIVKKFNLDSEL